MIAVYLIAIIAANLSVAYFGPVAVIPNSFLLIGLDLVTRDALHDRWQGRQLPIRMAVLIATGSLLSWLLNRNAGPIALASLVAFGVAATVDSIAYHLLRRYEWLTRSNVSNLYAAAADSLLFPTLAFGAFLPWIVLGQFVAKVVGGLIWSVVLRHRTAS